MKRLLITGAAGSLGRVARRKLAHMAETIRVTDIADLGNAEANEELVPCDLADPEAVLALVEGCDGIVHLGGVATEQGFSAILAGNILGVRNLYEAARAHGHPRIFFAGSNHVIGFYDQSQFVDHNSAHRPDGMYGVSKSFGEALARFYYDKFGQETAIVRIGSCFEKPTDYRMLSTWLSYDDLASLVERVFAVPRLGCPVIWGVSDNKRALWSNDHVRYLGWTPKDSADAFAADVPLPAPDSPLVVYHGGNNTQDTLL